MKKKAREYFRRELTRQLEELTLRSEASIAELLDSAVSAPDPIDRTSLELERDLTLHMIDRENRLILKIKKALQKIEDETFGICEVCGEQIDIERLKLRPVTELCIGCKIEQEKMERLTCE